MDFLRRPIPKSFQSSSAGWDNFLKNLQANIVKHHNRAFAHFVFIRFENPDQIEKIKKLIADFSGKITNAYEQLGWSKSESKKTMLRSCLISREGISFLNINNESIKFLETEYSEIYEISQDDDKIDDFFMNHHLLIILAHANEAQLKAVGDIIFLALEKKDISFFSRIEKGALKKNDQKKSIETFGFRDGISQPEVLREKIDEHRTDAWDPAATLGLAFFDMITNNVKDYGSFAAYLKIEQSKKVFDKNVETIAAYIKDEGLNFDQKKELAAAYLMGRFKDGTPVINSNKKCSIDQDKKCSTDKDMNNFNYGASFYSLAQNKCPLFAHIFKSNPRNKPDIRIFRRGIPFQEADGLHFLSYQSDIEKQFLKIYRDWIGHQANPALNSEFGRDPIMMTDRVDGAANAPNQSPKRIPKVWGKGNPADSEDYFAMGRLDLPKPTTVRGVGFYFVPSLYFLENIQNL